MSLPNQGSTDFRQHRWFRQFRSVFPAVWQKIKKDMIIRGGENIQPTEIENYFHSHPGIEDIYVIGVPSKRLGEEVAAYISVPVISDYESAISNH